MDEYVLYGYPGSGSAAVDMALSIAGLRYRSVNAASWDAASELAELKRANPLLQIPALRCPDGSVMSESAAILIELGLRHPASGLLPAEPKERAQSIRGLVFIAANCYSAIGIIDYPDRYTSATDEAERKRVAEGTKARLHAMWTSFADSFAPHPFLAGERLGALDLLAVVVSKWSGSRQHLRATRPLWLDAIERTEQLPFVAETIARHWPPKA